MIKVKEKAVIEISRIKSGLNEDFNSFKWLLKARQPDRVNWKPVFSKVYADKKKLVCTDTRRMHLINNSFEIIPGLYDVLVSDNKKIVLSASDCEDKFPDYKVLIKNDSLVEILSTPNGLTDANISRLYKNFYQTVKNQTVGFGFDMSFMRQAFKTYTSMSVLIKLTDKGFYSGTDPIRIQDSAENHVAVIMPIRLREDDK